MDFKLFVLIIPLKINIFHMKAQPGQAVLFVINLSSVLIEYRRSQTIFSRYDYLLLFLHRLSIR